MGLRCMSPQPADASKFAETAKRFEETVAAMKSPADAAHLLSLTRRHWRSSTNISATMIHSEGSLIPKSPFCPRPGFRQRVVPSAQCVPAE
jgi:hypothetical protein